MSLNRPNSWMFPQTMLEKFRSVLLLFRGEKCRNFFLLKVSYFQNEFMKSKFLPKYERKVVRISALCSKGSFWQIFVRILGESNDFINSFWNELTFKEHPKVLFKISSEIFVSFWLDSVKIPFFFCIGTYLSNSEISKGIF